MPCFQGLFRASPHCLFTYTNRCKSVFAGVKTPAFNRLPQNDARAVATPPPSYRWCNCGQNQKRLRTVPSLPKNSAAASIHRRRLRVIGGRDGITVRRSSNASMSALLRFEDRGRLPGRAAAFIARDSPARIHPRIWRFECPIASPESGSVAFVRFAWTSSRLSHCRSSPSVHHSLHLDCPAKHTQRPCSPHAAAYPAHVLTAWAVPRFLSSPFALSKFPRHRSAGPPAVGPTVVHVVLPAAPPAPPSRCLSGAVKG